MNVIKVNSFNEILPEDTVVFDYGGAMYGTLRVLKVHSDRIFAIENWERSGWRKPQAFVIDEIKRISQVYRDSGWDA